MTTGYFTKMLDELPTKWQLPDPTTDEKKRAMDAGIKALGDRELIEENIASPVINSPSYRHQRAVSTTLEARILTKRGYVENHATNEIAKMYNKHDRNLYQLIIMHLIE